MSDEVATLPTNEMLEMIKIQGNLIQQLLNYNRELIQIIHEDNKVAREMLLELLQKKLNT